MDHLTSTTTLDMVIWRHFSTYKNFIKTIHYLNIPFSNWNITFHPTIFHMERGAQRYHLIRVYGLPSLYMSIPNPKLLLIQPFEVETIEETEEEGEESPTPSPPSTPTPSTSKGSYSSHVLEYKR